MYSCYLCIVVPALSTCSLHTNSGCEKERRVLTGPWWPAKAAPLWNYFEACWPCAGRHSAVDAIGLHQEMDAAVELRRNPVSKHQIQPEY